MSILRDGVFTSISYHGRGMFRFDKISYDHKILLKSITQKQRRKFVVNGIIPRQLLQVLWDLDYLPGKERPIEGTGIKVFLEFLQSGKYRNKKNYANGVWLRDKIEKQECTSDSASFEIFIKCGRGKFGAVSILRKEPGTIFR